MYLTYDEFLEYNVYDFELDENQFKNYEYKARMKVDRFTQNRISKLDTTPENIKRLMVELINILYTHQENLNQAGNIKTVSNDGYSVTYGDLDSESAVNIVENKIYSLITDYARDFCWRGID